MLDLSFFVNNPYFEEITLDKSSVLFDEWDVDDNLYIIKSWKLSIQKYVTNERKELKILATLESWAIFWEWSLKKSDPKEVKIIALEKTLIFKINVNKWINWFIKEFPDEWIILLTEIIDITNKRLLESNFLLTSSYQMSKIISEIDQYDNKSLFYIINEFQKTIKAEYIIYLEKNPVIDHYMMIKYDTRSDWKLQNNLVDLQDKILDLKDLEKDWIILEKYNLIQALRNKNEIIWYLIIWEIDNKFLESKRKAISATSSLIAWVIKQKQAYEEQVNLDYLNEE